MNNPDEIEKLRRELAELRVITMNLKNQNVGLENNNRTLSRRINRLEQIISRTFEAGDRVDANDPTCPGRNRNAIPADRFAIVNRVEGDWACFVCDSGAQTKRCPRNLALIRRDCV